ncbi:MAG TPA: FAD-linked oxidase C-terminal domain-containing protein [Burkholderiales bacterium]|jgi:D-lactate dehydrogenase (cytochrome)|nr:FAD-linked oxidase C-terminal domain-containing protein [Burkholderiales bacterium]
MNKAREFDQSVLAELKALLGDRVTTAAAVREHHGKDESYFPYAPPDAVVFASSTEEVRDIVNICRRHRVPMIPFGVGTSLEGHILAVQGGVSIDLSQMNQVLAVHEEDLDAVVQAGVTRKQLNEYIKHTGLFFPVDPGADATLGGMASTRASGTNAVRYGTMRENVLSLKVVLADGRVIQTARRAKKSAAGYDLTRLFVGAEGTLGIVTEVTVRLYPVQEAMSSAVCAFDSVDGCTNTVIQTIQSGIPVARCDIVCDKTIAAINAYKKTSYRVAPTVFFEFHGTKSSVVEQAEAVQAIAKEHGGKDFVWATLPEERTQLWQARHDAYFACLQLRPGSRAVSTDVCVPISRLAECVHETMEDVKNYIVPVPLLGHIGDGNFHLIFLIDPQKPEEIDIAKQFNKRLVERALRMEGTCTGEHGIGMGKMGSMRMELGEDVIDVMRDIKRVLDPDNLMNPGKVVSL